MEPPINANNYFTDEDSVDEGLISNINHTLASLLNTNIIINSPDSKKTEVVIKF